MTEKFLNMHRWNPGGHKMRSVRVTESVRSSADIQPRSIPVKSDELLNATNREMTAYPIIEERSLRGLRQTKLIIESENFTNALLSDLIERDNPAARPFANGSGEMKKTTGLTVTGNQTNSETRDLTNPKTGVIQEQDEQIIAAAKDILVQVDGAENAADFGLR